MVRVWQKSVVIWQTSKPKSYQITSTEPINSMLISTIISWHVHMVIINGFGVVIWPMWVMLGRICVQDVTKSVVLCPITSEPKSYQMTSTEPINSMHIISTIIFWHVQMVIINGFGMVIWPMWVMLGRICGRGLTKISCDLPNNFQAKILPSSFDMSIWW
jgi:hypothetical protein